jgi:hypothetical protein
LSPVVPFAKVCKSKPLISRTPGSALVEPFDPSSNPDFKPEKEFEARVVLLNRDTVLTETTPQEFATAQGFRLLTEDNVAANPAIACSVESFEPTQSFKPAKPYRTRLNWRDQEGNEQSKLLLTKPETVLSLVLRRGESGLQTREGIQGARRGRARCVTLAASTSPLFPPSLLDRVHRGLLAEGPAPAEAAASLATGTKWRSAPALAAKPTRGAKRVGRTSMSVDLVHPAAQPEVVLTLAMRRFASIRRVWTIL